MYNNNYQNYYQQPQMQPQRAPSINPYGLKGRPVASLDEVRAASIDFDGTVFFFPDLANKRIYTKQITMDGTAIFNMYELKEMPTPQASPMIGDYITRKEFEEALTSIKMALQQKTPAPPPIEEPMMSF